MGLFDTTEQQAKARNLGRQSFLQKSREGLAKKLIQDGHVKTPSTPEEKC